VNHGLAILAVPVFQLAVIHFNAYALQIEQEDFVKDTIIPTHVFQDHVSIMVIALV
jgi:hypothetical protein